MTRLRPNRAERVKRIVIGFAFVVTLVLLLANRDSPDAPSLDESIGWLGGIAALYFVPLWWPEPPSLPEARARR